MRRLGEAASRTRVGWNRWDAVAEAAEAGSGENGGNGSRGLASGNEAGLVSAKWEGHLRLVATAVRVEDDQCRQSPCLTGFVYPVSRLGVTLLL